MPSHNQQDKASHGIAFENISFDKLIEYLKVMQAYAADVRNKLPHADTYESRMAISEFIGVEMIDKLQKMRKNEAEQHKQQAKALNEFN